MEILGLGLGAMVLLPLAIYIISLCIVIKFISHITEGKKSTLDWLIIIFGTIFAFVPGTNVAIAFCVIIFWIFNRCTKIETI
jgi:hypothetical protein